MNKHNNDPIKGSNEAANKGSNEAANKGSNEAANSASDTPKTEAVLNTATKAMDYVKGAGFKYLHLGKIAMEHRELEQKRLEVLQKIGLQCVQSMQDGAPLDDTLFKTLYDAYGKIVQNMDDLNIEKGSVKKIDPAKVKSSKYDH